MTDVSRPLQYVEMEAAPALSDVVMSYWSFQVHALPTPDFVRRVWPTGVRQWLWDISTTSVSLP